MPKLSILICHLPKRAALLTRLRSILDPQVNLPLVEVLIHDQVGISIGEKRNQLLQDAKGEYVAFIDDDDFISHNYVRLLMMGIFNEVDCCSLTGEMTTDGKDPRKFIHSIRYKSWYEENGVYYRNTNHLNAIKSSIAKQIKYPAINHGEDRSYSKQLLESGLLKTEHWINETIYFYDYQSKKK